MSKIGVHFNQPMDNILNQNKDRTVNGLLVSKGWDNIKPKRLLCYCCFIVSGCCNPTDIINILKR